jgi:thiol:disulfide interchange protein
MRISGPSRFQLHSWVVSGLIGAVVFGCSTVAFADDPAPKKKDSPKALQPRELTWTTSVSPKNAKPGDTVTYSVTVKIKAPWHIYAYEKTPPEKGPKSTDFDFFDMADLEPVGEWTPSDPPIQKAEPAFDNMVLKFYEDTVTWSHKLNVPANAAPGTTTLRNQVYFQICDPKSCKSPTRFTLPDATLVIQGKGGSASILALPSAIGLLTAPFAAPGPSPKHEDSNKFVIPGEAKWSTSVTPERARPGDVVTYAVTAKLMESWHIYPYAEKQPIDNSNVATQFDFFDPSGLTVTGKWKPDRRPTQHEKGGEIQEYYTEKATWKVELKIPTDAAVGLKTLRNQVHFQVCQIAACKQPVFVTLPDVKLTIEAAPRARESAALLVPLLVGFLPAETAARPAILTPPKAAAGTVQASIDQGLVSFLLFSAAGGLVAILMPCVWPMIPITVNFFVKQGNRSKGQATKLAIVYSLAIIGIFTSLGLAVTFARGATGASALGNNPWLNLIMGVAFIAMGLSLLGLFEIRLPTALLNKSAAAEGKGGIVGVMFMATTLTITSFTCTAPVVGGLLGLATRGHILYPVLGMLTFSTVLALPFFVIALVPSVMSKLPRSGDWMNTVKVVGALVEIGAAFKFLNTAEISFGSSPANAWINSYVILTAWVVMSLVAGIYLLGLFRTDHDHDAIKIGPLRLMFGSLFVGVALFLAPALFGNPPKSRFYDFVAGILPADSANLDVAQQTTTKIAEAIAAAGGQFTPNSATALAGGEPRTLTPIPIPKKATSNDPKQAVREEKKAHGVLWGMSYEDALAEAKATGKPVLIDFTGLNCVNCRVVERSIMPRPDVVDEMRKFVPVQLFTDFLDIDSLTKDQQEEAAVANLERENEMTGETSQPLYVVLSPDGKFVDRIGYEPNDTNFLRDFLKRAREKVSESQKVARSD